VSCSNKIRVGGIGTVLEIICLDEACKPLDVSGATKLDMIVIKGDGSRVVVAAVVSTDGTDGAIRYVTEDAAFISVKGQWQRSADIAIPGWAGQTDPIDFMVYPAL